MPEMGGKGSYKWGLRIDAEGGEAAGTQIRSWNPCMKFTGGVCFQLGITRCCAHHHVIKHTAIFLCLTFHNSFV